MSVVWRLRNSDLRHVIKIQKKKKNPKEQDLLEGVRVLAPSWITVLSRPSGLCNSVKLWAMQGHRRWTDHSGEFWQHVVHWRREWQTTLVFLAQEPHEHGVTKSQKWKRLNNDKEFYCCHGWAPYCHCSEADSKEQSEVQIYNTHVISPSCCSFLKICRLRLSPTWAKRFLCSSQGWPLWGTFHVTVLMILMMTMFVLLSSSFKAKLLQRELKELPENSADNLSAD